MRDMVNVTMFGVGQDGKGPAKVDYFTLRVRSSVGPETWLRGGYNAVDRKTGLKIISLSAKRDLPPGSSWILYLDLWDGKTYSWLAVQVFGPTGTVLGYKRVTNHHQVSVWFTVPAAGAQLLVRRPLLDLIRGPSKEKPAEQYERILA